MFKQLLSKFKAKSDDPPAIPAGYVRRMTEWGAIWEPLSVQQDDPGDANGGAVRIGPEPSSIEHPVMKEAA